MQVIAWPWSGMASSGRTVFLNLVTRERQDPVPTLERWNDQKVVLLTGVSDLPGSLPDAHDRGHGPLLLRYRPGRW